MRGPMRRFWPRRWVSGRNQARHRAAPVRSRAKRHRPEWHGNAAQAARTTRGCAGPWYARADGAAQDSRRQVHWARPAAYRTTSARPRPRHDVSHTTARASQQTSGRVRGCVPSSAVADSRRRRARGAWQRGGQPCTTLQHRGSPTCRSRPPGRCTDSRYSSARRGQRQDSAHTPR